MNHRPCATRIVALGLAALGLASTGCIRAGGPELDPTPRAAGRDPFPYPGGPFRFEILDLPDDDEAYDTAALLLEASEPADTVAGEIRALLRTPREPNGAFVIVLPILGGDYAPSDTFARDLAERGYTTARFYRNRDPFATDGDLDTAARRIRQSVGDIRRAIDWALTSGGFSRGRIGLLGISMGSMGGTLATAADERIDAAVLALGGSGLAEPLETAADEDEIKAFLDALKARGMTTGEIREEAHMAFDPIDPARFGWMIDPTRVLMVHARFDAVVPYEHGTELWEAADRPERITLPTGHYSTVLAVPYLKCAFADWFEEKLLEAPAPAAPGASSPSSSFSGTMR